MKFVIALFLFFLIACNNNTPKPVSGITISSDTSILSIVTDIDVYKPTAVWFTYVPVVPFDKNDRLPGPKDYYLNAILEFDKSTITELFLRSSRDIEKLITPQQAAPYKFPWIPDKLLNEIEQSAEIKEYAATKFYKGILIHGNFIIVGNKVVLILFTM